MNISAVRWVVLLALVAVAAAADAEEDYDEELAPAPVKPALRPSPLLRTARGPAIGRSAPKNAVTQKTTTTTEAAPPAEYEDEEFEEEVAEETPTTTTEAPKKGGLKTGVVRPFRSNTDLIEALKRRRQQHSSGGISTHSTSTTTEPALPPSSDKGFKSGRRSGSKVSQPADQTSSNSERRPTVNGRRFSARGSTKTTEAPEEEEPLEPVRPSTSRFAKNRRF